MSGLGLGSSQSHIDERAQLLGQVQLGSGTARAARQWSMGRNPQTTERITGSDTEKRRSDKTAHAVAQYRVCTASQPCAVLHCNRTAIEPNTYLDRNMPATVPHRDRIVYKMGTVWIQ